MASAGRILIMPKGDYNAETTYEMLDLVFHGGTSWLARKEVIGIEPSGEHSEHWFKMCEATDLTEVENRLKALESQMLASISLDDIDLTPYATKTEVNAISSFLSGLDERLDDVEPKVTALQTDINNISAAKIEVKTYAGTGGYGSSNPCSVTFSFAPKIVLMLGWIQGESKYQMSINGIGYTYCSNTIFCDVLGTTYSEVAGFSFSGTNNGPGRFAKKSSDGKTIYWYLNSETNVAQSQLNAVNNTYYVLAIG